MKHLTCGLLLTLCVLLTGCAGINSDKAALTEATADDIGSRLMATGWDAGVVTPWNLTLLRHPGHVYSAFFGETYQDTYSVLQADVMLKKIPRQGKVHAYLVQLDGSTMREAGESSTASGYAFYFLAVDGQSQGFYARPPCNGTDFVTAENIAERHGLSYTCGSGNGIISSNGQPSEEILAFLLELASPSRALLKWQDLSYPASP